MATHDDFTAAKYQASVAMYCGSISQVKPGCRSLRGGSIDSNLQLCGNKWMTANEASLRSVLKDQACLWGKSGELLDICPLESWDTKNFLQKKNTNSTAMGDSSLVPSLKPKQDPSKLEVSSAAMETAQIKDKLKKRRMSEVTSNKGLLDSSSSKGLVLKPALSRSASQRLLITSKPMPPIQSIPTSPEINGADGREQKVLENGTGYLEVGTDHPESIAAAQQILHGHNEKLRKSLGTALIPPISSSAKACEDNSQKFQEPLSSSSQLKRAPDATEETPEARSKPEPCNTEENILKTLDVYAPMSYGVDNISGCFLPKVRSQQRRSGECTSLQRNRRSLQPSNETFASNFSSIRHSPRIKVLKHSKCIQSLAE